MLMYMVSLLECILNHLEVDELRIIYRSNIDYNRPCATLILVSSKHRTSKIVLLYSFKDKNNFIFTYFSSLVVY